MLQKPFAFFQLHYCMEGEKMFQKISLDSLLEPFDWPLAHPNLNQFSESQSERKNSENYIHIKLYAL